LKSKPENKRGDRHADGTARVHGDDSLVRGLYVAQLSFSRAGDWGVELHVSQANGAAEPVRLAVTVQDSSPTPAVGSAAPRSRNLIARDVKVYSGLDHRLVGATGRAVGSPGSGPAGPTSEEARA